MFCDQENMNVGLPDLENKISQFNLNFRYMKNNFLV